MIDAKKSGAGARPPSGARRPWQWRSHPGAVQILLACSALSVCCTPAVRAQSVDDEHVLGKHEFLTGLSYSYDSWEDYWEGTLKRRNGNIGEITTRTALWSATYGITDRLNVITTIPYVWTDASQGWLHSMEGFQDITLAGKYRLLDTPFTSLGSLRAFAVVAGSTPLSDYTPDFAPLSIGSASDRLSGRLTLNFRAEQGWFVNATAAYTWRDNVTLDRPYYYTDGRLYLTDQVEMPDVFDYTVGAGYARSGVMGSLFFSEQVTQGGGDIRRQDAPFVSHRFNYSKVGAVVTYSPAALRNLELRLAYAYTVEGRNVGEATTLTSGVSYKFDFDGREAQ